MEANDRQEFIIMLLIENRSYCSSDNGIFYNFIKEHYDLNKFMKPYALNKTEKSE